MIDFNSLIIAGAIFLVCVAIFYLWLKASQRKKTRTQQ